MINFEEEKLKKTIQRIVKKHGFYDDTEIILFEGSEKGGYMGEVVRIVVKLGTTKNTLNFIAKISLKDETVRESVPFAEMYGNEILSYEKILPALLSSQIEANSKELFNPIAKFYGASTIINEEYLILEDLKVSGFETLGIRELLDHDHAKIICETYGKLHGLSFAMKTMQKEKFRELTSQLKNAGCIIFTETKMGLEFAKIWDYIRNVMKERGIESDLLNNYVENSTAIMTDMYSNKEMKFCCFLHGDSWSNNLMFRHKDNNGHKEVEEIKLIDWQACVIGPPVFDLSYSLYSGASKKVLANLGTYLKIYHSTLSKSLSQFNLDVNSVYPLEEMKRQWEKYHHFGVILSGTIWKVRSFDEHQGVDPLSYTSDDECTYLEAMADAQCNTDFLYEHIKDLFEHLDETAKGDILN